MYRIDTTDCAEQDIRNAIELFFVIERFLNNKRDAGFNPKRISNWIMLNMVRA